MATESSNRASHRSSELAGKLAGIQVNMNTTQVTERPGELQCPGSALPAPASAEAVILPSINLIDD